MSDAMYTYDLRKKRRKTSGRVKVYYSRKTACIKGSPYGQETPYRMIHPDHLAAPRGGTFLTFLTMCKLQVVILH
jgi:hypothetical protein